MKKFFGLVFPFLASTFIAQAQSYTFGPLVSFNKSNGRSPQAGLVLTNDTLYGTTAFGGAYDEGTIFSVGTDGGGFKTLHSFNQTNGSWPAAAMMLSGDTLYGVTSYGGVSNLGAVFSINTDGTGFSVLHSFDGFDGNAPEASLILVDGLLYGTTDGSATGGTIFSLSTNGSGFTTVYEFSGNDGTGCLCSLVESNGTLYGATLGGGISNLGAVFSVGTNGLNFNVLHVFSNVDLGGGSMLLQYGPEGGLVLTNGTLYGVTGDAGQHHSGRVFSVGTNGSNYTDLHLFTTNDGEYPIAALTLASNVLYGTVEYGGTGNGGGIFSINPDGSGFTDIQIFPNTGPVNPVGGVIPFGGSFYTTAENGGPDSDGAVVVIAPSGGGGGGGNTNVVVTTNGMGKITPNVNLEHHKNGTKVTLTATPDKGYVFSGWTGSVTNSDNVLTFEWEPGLMFTGNFIPTPFPAVAGSYSGLFSDSNYTDPAGSGLVKSLTIKSNGAYSGTLELAGGSYAFSGAMPANLNAVANIKRPAAKGGPVTLSFTSHSPELAGMVSNASWTASFNLYPAVKNTTSGPYTMALPPGTNAGTPLGFGYFLIDNTAATATAKFSGFLADGTAVSLSSPVTTWGLPIYVPLYHNAGLLAGWVTLGPVPEAWAGLTWMQPAQATGLFPAGFTNVAAANQIPAPAWSSSPGSYTGLTSVALLTNDVAMTVNAAGKITGTGVTGSVNTKTGQFSVVVGTGTAQVKAAGVILAGTGNGGDGFYLTKTNSQPVRLAP